MTINFGFYDSLSGDRVYSATQMSAIFDGIITDGIFQNVGSAFSVLENTGMDIQVGIGRAWLNSTWTHNDAILSLTVATADPTLPRIDTVVIEVNSDPAVRANTIKIIAGTPASSPVAPTLTDSGFVHQHPLADIAVGAAVTSISNANITNRIGTDTPFITGLLTTIDMDWLFAQWEADFDDWFSNLVDQLSGVQVTNLQNQIDVLDSRVDAIEAEIASGVDPTLSMIGMNTSVWDDKFNSLSALPAGWAWAGTPFVTPDVVDYSSKFVAWRDTNAVANRNFLYKSAASLTPGAMDILAHLAGSLYTNGFFHGVRLDDGTDNNYVEFGQYRATTGNLIRWYYYYRIGGGAVQTAELETTWGFVFPPIFLITTIAIRDTPWSDWDYRGQLVGDMVYQKSVPGGTALTWTPSRVGVTQRRQTYAWDTSKLSKLTVYEV